MTRPSPRLVGPSQVRGWLWWGGQAMALALMVVVVVLAGTVALFLALPIAAAILIHVIRVKRRLWQAPPRPGPATGQVIDGQYEVVDTDDRRGTR